MDKIHINIDEKLKHEVKVKAANKRVTITQVVSALLKGWVRGKS